MKKLVFLSAATFILAVSANAQNNDAMVKNKIKSEKKEEPVIKEERKKLRKLEGKEVSYQAKQAFIKDFGNLPVTKWERMDNFDKATFSKNGQVLSAFYDYDAKLVGTTQYKTFNDLPANAQKYINEKYKDYTKGQVIFFDDNELNETDMILFGTQFDDADNYFVELQKDNKKIMLQVNMSGAVSFFKQIK